VRTPQWFFEKLRLKVPSPWVRLRRPNESGRRAQGTFGISLVPPSEARACLMNLRAARRSGFRSRARSDDESYLKVDTARRSDAARERMTRVWPVVIHQAGPVQMPPRSICVTSLVWKPCSECGSGSLMRPKRQAKLRSSKLDDQRRFCAPCATQPSSNLIESASASQAKSRTVSVRFPPRTTQWEPQNENDSVACTVSKKPGQSAQHLTDRNRRLHCRLLRRFDWANGSNGFVPFTATGLIPHKSMSAPSNAPSLAMPGSAPLPFTSHTRGKEWSRLKG